MSGFSFLSDLQQPNRPFVPGPPAPGASSPETSAYWERSGRPQLENGPGPQFPPLEHATQQLTGSRMFTPMSALPQQPAPSPQQQQQQQGIPSPLQLLQRDNAHLRSQLNAVVAHLQQQQKTSATTGNKRTTELLVSVMVVLFAGVLVMMFVTMRKVSAASAGAAAPR